MNEKLTYGITLFGNTPFSNTSGLTQGSQLSPGVCYICGLFLEATSTFDIFAGLHAFWVDLYVKRWVDDVFMIMVIRNLKKKERIDAMVKKIVNTFESIYNEYFHMKEEDPQIFIGIDMFLSDSGCKCCAHSVNMNRDCEIELVRPRFHHWWSNSPVCKKKNVVKGQLLRCCDYSHAESEKELERAFICICVEFLSLRYPFAVLCKAVASILRKHRHLTRLIEWTQKAKDELRDVRLKRLNQ